ncbi:MAG: AAA family ATPase [Gammaproteobacteria bacterium]|nr:AAA family ATPase [Gammaproteobacteria bacterium]
MPRRRFLSRRFPAHGPAHEGAFVGANGIMAKMRKATKTPAEGLRISVRNFGPIAKAENIALRPLTVFAGPGNTGKSYLAILLYSLLQRSHHLFRKGIIGRAHKPGEPVIGSRAEKDAIDKDLRKMDKEGGLRFSQLSRATRDWAKRAMAEDFENMKEAWRKELQICMGESSMKGLTPDRKNNRPSSIRLTLKDGEKGYAWCLNKRNTAANFDSDSFDFNIKTGHNAPLNFSVRIGRDTSSVPRIVGVYRLFLNLLESSAFEELHTPALYLPAARTGIMQSYKALASAIVSRASFSGDISIPTLNGVLTDFLQALITIDKKGEPSAMASIAASMEKEILEGDIAADFSESAYPAFVYRKGKDGAAIPIIRASSMVTELAPVILFLRYYVEKDSILIIEEPEAHLHPWAQRVVARALVQLARSGVRVVVTTHSDYILDQLANYVRVAGFDKKERKLMTGDEDLYLETSEVGCYVFKAREEGTLVEELQFDPEGGILPKDHEDISLGLYNETAAILNKSQ